MKFEFFTQNVEMSSPTYFNKFKDDNPRLINDNYDCTVRMTADIDIYHEPDAGEYSGIYINVSNRMWEDPEANEELPSYFSLEFGLTDIEVIHLKKFLEAYLESREK